jgi:hypothetical protein
MKCSGQHLVGWDLQCYTAYDVEAVRLHQQQATKDKYESMYMSDRTCSVKSKAHKILLSYRSLDVKSHRPRNTCIWKYNNKMDLKVKGSENVIQNQMGLNWVQCRRL